MVYERFKTSHDQIIFSMIVLITSTTTLNPVSTSSIGYPDMYKSIWISLGLMVGAKFRVINVFCNYKCFIKNFHCSSGLHNLGLNFMSTLKVKQM